MKHTIYLIFVLLGIVFPAAGQDGVSAKKIIVDAGGGGDFRTVGDALNSISDGYHRDAQFYLIHCHFAANMADQDIYLVPTANVIQWGRRIYYYDCHKDGGEPGEDRCGLGFRRKMGPGKGPVPVTL